MKIVYIHQYFRTPEQGGAIRSYHLAKALAEAGHEVEMITSHNHPDARFMTIEGINVHYLPVYYDNHLSYFRRSVSFIKFLYQAYRKAISLQKIDLCYATSTPLTVGLIALRLLKKYGIPYYFEVRDLWPEAPVQMGAVKSRWLKKILFRLEQKLYDRAAKIIALSPGIEKGIREKTPTQEIHMIPNFSDCDFFQPSEKKHSLEEKFSVRNKFVISYFGTIGKANHLDYILQAALAASKQSYDQVHFIIAGTGSEQEAIEEKARQWKVRNISFTGFVNKEALLEILNVTDAIYISFAKIKVLETNSPNKFFDGLAAGKLCISNTAGWLKELIEQHECGFYYDPEQPDDFLQNLHPYLKDLQLLQTAKHNARQLAENNFSKTQAVQHFLSLFNAVPRTKV